MATSKQCSTCQKEIGANYCMGCKAHFCMKDLKDHRSVLDAELDMIIEGRNELEENINRAIEQPICAGPLILQIEEWEKEMICKVKQVAEQARQRITELLNAKRTQIAFEFQTFSSELTDRKESENFFEPDLVRLQQLIGQFNHELNQLSQPLTIQLGIQDSSHIDWNRLVSIGTMPCRRIYQEPPKPSEFIIIYLIDC